MMPKTLFILRRTESLQYLRPNYLFGRSYHLEGCVGFNSRDLFIFNKGLNKC